MKFFRYSVSGASGLFGGRETTDEINNVILGNTSHPCIRRFRERYPTEPRGVVVLNKATVRTLVRLCRRTELRPAVVEGITVAMICAKRSDSHDLFLHRNHSLGLAPLRTTFSSGIESARGIDREPKVLHQRFIVALPYECVLSLRERYFPTPLAVYDEYFVEHRRSDFRGAAPLARWGVFTFFRAAPRAIIVGKPSRIGVRTDNSSCHRMALRIRDVVASRSHGFGVVYTNVFRGMQ